MGLEGLGLVVCLFSFFSKGKERMEVEFCVFFVSTGFSVFSIFF